MASQSHGVSAVSVVRYRGAARCRAKFLRAFPAGFRDPTYLAWERDYKWRAHTQWHRELAAPRLRALLAAGAARDIAATAVRIESRTNLLFSFEKMALRDAVRTPAGARQFATGLYAWLHGRGTLAHRFARWSASVEALPRRQTRVWTWPVLTVFGFVAQPETHVFLKPTVTRIAADKFGFDLVYAARPSWDVYANVLRFAAAVRASISDLRPRDMIDVQSFIWVQGSEEY